MSRLPRLVSCATVVLLAVPLATSAFAASPSMPSTTSTTMPAPRTSGVSPAPLTRNSLTAGPLLPVNPNPNGKLPFSATRNTLTANPSWLPGRPVSPPSSAGPSNVTTPGATVSPNKVQLPGITVSPNTVKLPGISVGPAQATTPPASVGRGGLTTNAPILTPDGRQIDRSRFNFNQWAQPGTVDVAETLHNFFDAPHAPRRP